MNSLWIAVPVAVGEAAVGLQEESMIGAALIRFAALASFRGASLGAGPCVIG